MSYQIEGPLEEGAEVVLRTEDGDMQAFIRNLQDDGSFDLDVQPKLFELELDLPPF